MDWTAVVVIDFGNAPNMMISAPCVALSMRKAQLCRNPGEGLVDLG